MPPPAEPELVLVVEDDRALAVGLDLNLTAEGFRVLVARDGDAGLRLALAERPDLIVLDLMLPCLDGFELLRQLRRNGETMPVIILSARGEEQEKVRGLNLGADDYVTKPFGLAELVARIHATLRRERRLKESSSVLEFGELEIDLTSKTVTSSGVAIKLTAKEFSLLAYLAREPGRAYSRERLLQAVWGFDYEGTARTVDNFVRNLRVKIEPDPARPRFIQTVHGIGYRFQQDI